MSACWQLLLSPCVSLKVDCDFVFAYVWTFCWANTWFCKTQRASDDPALRTPKIEPWSQPSDRSGPASSSRPAPHTVVITWTLQITLWHKTRVCPLHGWAGSINPVPLANVVQLHQTSMTNMFVMFATDVCDCCYMEGSFGVSEGFLACQTQ